MASWRPPDSILEASGPHFGGSGPHFRRLWTSYLEPRTPRTPKNLQKQKLHHKVARPPKGGWAAVTPGGFQWNWLKIAISSIRDAPFLRVKSDVLKNRVLERSGLDFGASGEGFQRRICY